VVVNCFDCNEGAEGASSSLDYADSRLSQKKTSSQKD